ncbi:hypothetical protein CDAR_231521 [Caerostris darwini]|uniref:Uncharacterized protein n=1 Tax=Caerostris darwini TaxID=1538125 RepID=A0AAV4UH29_9ARAC|nr:hypothetical protein CDAR_231521 [Caerostris darwini]
MFTRFGKGSFHDESEAMKMDTFQLAKRPAFVINILYLFMKVRRIKFNILEIHLNARKHTIEEQGNFAKIFLMSISDRGPDERIHSEHWLKYLGMQGHK